jgi:hypothetical protein
LTFVLELGIDVEVPIMMPLSMVAVGLLGVLDCGSASVAPAQRAAVRNLQETMIIIDDIVT